MTAKNQFAHLGTTSRTHAVRDQLLQAISTGGLSPGDWLPSEGTLAEQFGVSRASVRMALGMLETMGVIMVHHGRGSQVAQGPSMSYIGWFAEWLQEHGQEVDDLMKVRGALDELAATEAACARDVERIYKVEAAHREFSEAATTGTAAVEQIVQLDIAFHNSIAEASDNTLLPSLLAELNSQLIDSRRAAFLVPDRVLRSADEHGAIVRALRARDPQGARRAAAAHLESSRGTLNDPAFIADLKLRSAPTDPRYS